MFTQEQQKWIDLGVEHNLDVSIYSEEGYSADQMEELYNGLLSGVDVLVYAYEVYSWQQMNIIRRGLEAGVDVKGLLDPGMYYRYMEEELNKLLAELPQPEHQEEVVEESEPEQEEIVNPIYAELISAEAETVSNEEENPEFEETLHWPEVDGSDCKEEKIPEDQVEYTMSESCKEDQNLVADSDKSLSLEEAPTSKINERLVGSEVEVSETTEATPEEEEEILKVWQAEYDAAGKETASTKVENGIISDPEIFFKDLSKRIRESADIVDFDAYFDKLKQKVDTQTDYVLNREFQEETVRRYFDTLYLSVEDAFLKFLEDMDERNKQRC